MDFLYRNAPAYKGSNAQPVQRTGLLAGLGTLGGSAAPAYRTVPGVSAQAPAPARNWWRALTVTPSYKTATVAPGEPYPDGGDGDEDECADSALQVVIL